jgi:hypothetical protein
MAALVVHPIPVAIGALPVSHLYNPFLCWKHRFQPTFGSRSTMQSFFGFANSNDVAGVRRRQGNSKSIMVTTI